MVSLLRGAGAIILGHANMSEWASVRTSSYSTGYSARGGQVRNPYNLSSSPCKFSNELERVLFRQTALFALLHGECQPARGVLPHV